MSEPHWISVTEQLPPTHHGLQLFDRRRAVLITYLYGKDTRVFCFGYYTGQDQWYNDEFELLLVDEKVTDWCPIEWPVWPKELPRDKESA